MINLKRVGLTFLAFVFTLTLSLQSANAGNITINLGHGNTEGSAYDPLAKKFAELGLAAPKTYADLAAPALQDKVSLPDINSGAGLANFGGVIYAAGGDEQNIQPGLDLMKKINATKFWTRGGETKTQ